MNRNILNTETLEFIKGIQNVLEEVTGEPFVQVYHNKYYPDVSKVLENHNWGLEVYYNPEAKSEFYFARPYPNHREFKVPVPNNIEDFRDLAEILLIKERQ